MKEGAEEFRGLWLMHIPEVRSLTRKRTYTGCITLRELSVGFFNILDTYEIDKIEKLIKWSEPIKKVIKI